MASNQTGIRNEALNWGGGWIPPALAQHIDSRKSTIVYKILLAEGKWTLMDNADHTIKHVRIWTQTQNKENHRSDDLRSRIWIMHIDQLQVDCSSWLETQSKQELMKVTFW